jgi:nucleoside-diphosphate-sugar epimerase
MTTVLLTGANGFTGHVMNTTLRDQGLDVVALASDLLDNDALSREVAQIQPDWVIHLAAMSFVGDTNIDAFYRVNVQGTLHLLDALYASVKKPARILIASSANIYGTPSVETIDETVVPAPVNHYACSKLAMEHMVSPWFERLPIVITRPFNYTGLGQSERFLIPKIVSHFAHRAPSIELGNLDVSRDFSDVRDVVKAYMALLKTDACGVKVNVCSGRVVSLQHIIEEMNCLAGYRIDVRVNQAFVRANEIPVLRGDHQLLHQLTGVTFDIPIEQTLHDMFTAQSEL